MQAHYGLPLTIIIYNQGPLEQIYRIIAKPLDSCFVLCELISPRLSHREVEAIAVHNQMLLR